MLERWITALQTEDPGLEEPAATRERLKDRFPKNATRRMTQLGLLVGATLEPLAPGENDTLIYATGYAESRALEGYLDSFPSASPTLFQTSIHPSAVQQALIARQQAVRQFFPMTGSAFLPAQMLMVALLADSPRTVVCGGEERATWLLEHNSSSTRTFAFAFALSASPENAIGRLMITDASLAADDPVNAADILNHRAGLTSPVEATAVAGQIGGGNVGGLSLVDFFDTLRVRRPFDAVIAPGRRLTLAWL